MLFRRSEHGAILPNLAGTRFMVLVSHHAQEAELGAPSGVDLSHEGTLLEQLLGIHPGNHRSNDSSTGSGAVPSTSTVPSSTVPSSTVPTECFKNKCAVWQKAKLEQQQLSEF
jgi:hypothetical protein